MTSPVAPPHPSNSCGHAAAPSQTSRQLLERPPFAHPCSALCLQRPDRKDEMSSGTPKHQRAEPGNAGSPGPTRNQAQQTWTPGNSKGLEWEYHCVYLGTSPGQRTLHLALLGGPGQAMAKREKWKCLSLSAWQGPQHRGWYCASLRYAARVWSSTLPEPPGSALFTTTGPFPNREKVKDGLDANPC